MTRLSDEELAGLGGAHTALNGKVRIDTTTFARMVAELRQSRAAALTKFERMVVEVWRDRLATDDTVDRTFIAILDKLATTKGEP